MDFMSGVAIGVGVTLGLVAFVLWGLIATGGGNES